MWTTLTHMMAFTDLAKSKDTRSMDLRMIFILLPTLLHVMSPVSALSKEVSHSCIAVDSEPNSVRIVFRIVTNDDTIDAVYAYDASIIDTSDINNRINDSACVKDGAVDVITYDNTVDITDASSLACGAALYDDNGVTIVAMLFQAYSTSNHMLIEEGYAFFVQCRMNDLTGAFVSTTNIDFGPGTIVTVVRQQLGLYLRVLFSSDKTPVRIASLGDRAILSIEINPEERLAPDDYGTLFYIGFLGNDPVTGNNTNRLYVIIQPRYNRRTDIRISTIDDSDTFTIEDGSSRVIDFSPELMGCSNDGESEQEFLGIEIDSDHMEIGVLVCNSATGSGDCYTALPAEEAGTDYFSTSMMVANEASEFMVIAHEDDTVVEISVPSGSGHTDAGTKTSVTLNKLEAYHFAISTTDPDTSSVNGYGFHSDKPYSLFSGNRRYSNDSMVTQVPPVEKFGTHYVLVSVDLLDDGRLTTYIIQAVVEGVTTTVTQYLPDSTTQDYNITTTTYPPQVIQVDSATQCEIMSNHPVMVTQVLEPAAPGDTNGFEGSMLVLPSVYQWSPSYAFNFNSSEYFVTTITVFKSSDDISNYRLNDQSIPPTDTVDIAGPNQYVFGKGITLPGNEKFEIVQTDGVTTMMTLCYASRGVSVGDSDVAIGFLPLGTRFANFGVCISGGEQGDGIDNDCDGLIDEEYANGTDVDGDSLYSEDPISATTEIADIVGVRPIRCQVSNDPTFPEGPFTYAITGSDGCVIGGSGPFRADGEIEPVTVENKFGSGVLPKVLQSGSFPLAMFTNAPVLYFMCTIEEYCTDDSDIACLEICQPNIAKRKKREVGDGLQKNISTYLWIFPRNRVNENTHTNATQMEASLSYCMNNTYIQVMLSFLAAVTITSLFSTLCFCCLIRRKRDRNKARRDRHIDEFRHKSF